MGLSNVQRASRGSKKDLIIKAGRCFQCLAAGHHNKDCKKTRVCGVGECKITRHSCYLHEAAPRQSDGHNPSPPQHADQQADGNRRETNNVHNQSSRVGNQLRSDAPAFNQQRASNESSRERGHKTGTVDSVSLMILPAFISSGSKEQRVNVMLDPCSTSSYVSESAAEELGIRGQPLTLTISRTGGTEILHVSQVE